MSDGLVVGVDRWVCWEAVVVKYVVEFLFVVLWYEYCVGCSRLSNGAEYCCSFGYGWLRLVSFFVVEESSKEVGYVCIIDDCVCFDTLATG